MQKILDPLWSNLPENSCATIFSTNLKKEACVFIPSPKEIQAMPDFTPNHPMTVLVSACLTGEACGVDGTSYGEYPEVIKLINLPNVKQVKFCPEHFSFGTPRHMPDIHGGNGFDVLDGKARVITDKGEDWTEGFIKAAQEMLKIALTNQVDLAVLMNMSAACGTLFISDGCRMVPQEQRKYQKGPGVCAALLIRNGIKVLSQRDYKTLDLIFQKLNHQHTLTPALIDLHEIDWYLNYFKI
ncbi:MAG: DUF523 domain-containing protein [Bdellovibrio sp.]|nr:DUF523 domain-containing protein [Bdellovibrio sp.]